MLGRKAASLFAAFLLGGCACGLPAGNVERVSTALVPEGFLHRRLASADFPIHAWLRPADAGTLTVVIEGDGAAWFNPRWPPVDPTPEASAAAAVALALPGPVAYLGRPCQFETAPACLPAYWIEARFAPEMVAALDRALNSLKAAARVEKLRLVGHSGGGVMAVLLAQRRRDVVSVLTLMAPLDLAQWTKSLGLSRLRGDDPARLPPLTLPAVHVAGGRDEIVPQEIVMRHVERKGGKFLLWPQADHACWQSEAVRRLLEEMP